MKRIERNGSRSVTARSVTDSTDTKLWQKIRAALPKNHTIPDPELVDSVLKKNNPN